MTALKELFDLSGRVAVVTGGSTGLGLQMAEAMAEFGAKVVICARKADRLATAEAKLREYGAEVLTVACDVAKAEAVALGTQIVFHHAIAAGEVRALVRVK